MKTRSAKKKHLVNETEECAPQNGQSQTAPETPGKINEVNERMQSPIFNFHIHIPPVNSSTPQVPLIQPIIHLHLDDKIKQIDLEKNAFQNVMNNSMSLLNLLAMSTPKSGVTATRDGDSSSFRIPNMNFENVNLSQSRSGHNNKNVESDQGGTVSESNFMLNNKTTRKKGQSSKTSKLKKSIKKRIDERKKDKDFMSITPSLEKKINALMKHHLQRSTSTCDETDRELDSEGNSVCENDNLASKLTGNDETSKIKEAVVVLKDISPEGNHRSSATDDCESVKTNEFPCSASSSKREIASCSNGEGKSEQGGYFLRIRDTPIKKSVTYSLGSSKKNNDLHEMRERPRRSNRNNANMTTPKNSFKDNMNGSPRKIITTKNTIKTPKESNVTKETSRTFEKCINTEDTNRKPQNNCGTDNMNRQNSETEDTNQTPKKWKNKEGTKSDTNITPEKNGFINCKGETLKKSYKTEDTNSTPKKSRVINSMKGSLKKNCSVGDRNRTPEKNSDTEVTNRTPEKNSDTEVTNRTPEKNSDTEVTNRTPEKNSGTDTSRTPENNSYTEVTSRTPENNSDTEVTNRTPEKNGNTKVTNTTPEKSSDTEDTNSTPEKNGNTEVTNTTPEKSSDTEDTNSTPEKSKTAEDTNRNSEKNGDMDEISSELTKRQRGIYSDSDKCESDSSEESDKEVDEENVKNNEKVERLEISKRDSNSSSDGSDSESEEIVNSSRKFNSPEETPKSSLTSTRGFGNDKLDQTPVKCSNGDPREKSSESEDSDASEESESAKNQEPGTPRKRHGEVYNEVYNNSEKEDVTSENLISVLEDCNFSEILKKIQDKCLRDKIKDVAERRRTISESVQYKDKPETVQEDGEGVNGETVDSGREGRERKEKESEDLDLNNDDELTPRSTSTNEDDKSTVEFKGFVSPRRENITDCDELVEPNLKHNCKKSLFKDPEYQLTHSKSDKNKANLKRNSQFCDEISIKLRALQDGSQQSPKSKERDSLDANNTQVDCNKKMRRQGLAKKSGEKKKRKPKTSPTIGGGQKKNVPSLKTSPPAKRRKLSKTKPPTGAKKPKIKFPLEGNYIPLQSSGSTRFAVAPLNELKPYQKHEAVKFKNRMLFGERVRRFSGKNELEVYKLKQKARRGEA